MRKAWLLLVPLALGSCNKIGFGAVSVTPIYGWTDGCYPIVIGGHGFDETVTATLAGGAITELSFPSDATCADEAQSQCVGAEDEAACIDNWKRYCLLDAGFRMSGIAPAASHGYADISVFKEDKESKLEDVFYFVECPHPGFVEGLGPTTGLTSGTTITLEGCGLSTDLRAVVGGGNPVALTAVCGSGAASFAAPDLAAGTYELTLIDGAGNLVFPANPCPVLDTGDTGGDSGGDTGGDSGDSGGGDTADTAFDTGLACDPPTYLTYGG